MVITSSIIWLLIFFTAIIVLFYRAVELRIATISLGIGLLICTIFSNVAGVLLVIFWVGFVLLLALNIPEIRRNYISTQVLKFYKSVLPKISQTEQETRVVI